MDDKQADKDAETDLASGQPGAKPDNASHIAQTSTGGENAKSQASSAAQMKAIGAQGPRASSSSELGNQSVWRSERAALAFVDVLWLTCLMIYLADFAYGWLMQIIAGLVILNRLSEFTRHRRESGLIGSWSSPEKNELINFRNNHYRDLIIMYLFLVLFARTEIDSDFNIRSIVPLGLYGYIAYGQYKLFCRTRDLKFVERAETEKQARRIIGSQIVRNGLPGILGVGWFYHVKAAPDNNWSEYCVMVLAVCLMGLVLMAIKFKFEHRDSCGESVVRKTPLLFDTLVRCCMAISFFFIFGCFCYAQNNTFVSYFLPGTFSLLVIVLSWMKMAAIAKCADFSVFGKERQNRLLSHWIEGIEIVGGATVSVFALIVSDAPPAWFVFAGLCSVFLLAGFYGQLAAILRNEG